MKNEKTTTENTKGSNQEELPVMSETINSVENDERKKLQRDIELATIRQKQKLAERARVPAGLSVDIVAEDPRDALARRLVPEAFAHEKIKFKPGQRRRAIVDYKRNSTMSTVYCPPLEIDHKRMMAQGWIPVQDEQGQHATEPGGDRLYKRDIVFERDAEQQSTFRTDAAIHGLAEETKANAPFKGEVEDEILVSKK